MQERKEQNGEYFTSFSICFWRTFFFPRLFAIIFPSISIFMFYEMCCRFELFSKMHIDSGLVKKKNAIHMCTMNIFASAAQVLSLFSLLPLFTSFLSHLISFVCIRRTCIRALNIQRTHNTKPSF